jgi:hypothetical protein
MNELPQSIKDRIEAIALPTFEQITEMGEDYKTTALTTFIYSHEPAGNKDEEEFRRQLKNVLAETRIDEALRTQPLLEALEKIYKGRWDENSEQLTDTDMAEIAKEAIKSYNSK